jgi:hypothetical protein
MKRSVLARTCVLAFVFAFVFAMAAEFEAQAAPGGCDCPRHCPSVSCPGTQQACWAAGGTWSGSHCYNCLNTAGTENYVTHVCEMDVRCYECIIQ